jgi:polyhydroxybutyrate depolymerase
MKNHLINIQYIFPCIVVVFLIIHFAQTLSYAQIQTGNFQFEGHLRNYTVFLPNDYTGNANFPLVIYLHSYGWTAQQGMNYTSLNQVADTADFIVAYPSAIPNWNSGIGDNPSWPTPNVNDVGFINALIDTLSNHYSIDLERIYACGYSNGGFMSCKLACQLSHRIAAIASVSGVLSTSTATSCNPFRTMPVLHIHGTGDSWVPINGTTGWHSVDQTLNYWTNFNNCLQVDTTLLPDLDPTDGCTIEKITYTNCTNNSDVIYYKVINGGHTWPGAGPPGYPAGNTDHDINAGSTIWNFFKGYQLTPTSVRDHKKDGIPSGYVLLNNYPNPFNPKTTIEFKLPKNEFVKLKVYNALGEEIAILVCERLASGTYKFEWDAGNLTSGVYYYRIDTGNFVDVKKMVLMK